MSSTAPKKPAANPPPPEPEAAVTHITPGDVVLFVEDRPGEAWLAIDNQHACRAEDWE